MTTRTEFLQARRAGIGGSDIATVMGINPWQTPLSLYLDKRGESVPEDISDKPAVYWGTVLEDVVAREYAERTEKKVQRIKKMMRHPQHSFALANIDRAIVAPGHRARWDGQQLQGAAGVLECKTANGFAAQEWGEQGSDYVPDHYLLQVQWYLGVTGLASGDLAVLIGGNDYRTYSLQRDDELLASLFDAAAEFWARVQEGRPPEPQSEAEAKQLWARHNPGKTVDLTLEQADDLRRLSVLKEQIKAMEAEEKALRDRIIPVLADAETAAFAGQRLATYKANKPSLRFDSKLLQQAKPDLYDAFCITTPGARVLRLYA